MLKYFDNLESLRIGDTIICNYKQTEFCRITDIFISVEIHFPGALNRKEKDVEFVDGIIIEFYNFNTSNSGVVIENESKTDTLRLNEFLSKFGKGCKEFTENKKY